MKSNCWKHFHWRLSFCYATIIRINVGDLTVREEKGGKNQNWASDLTRALTPFCWNKIGFYMIVIMLGRISYTGNQSKLLSRVQPFASPLSEEKGMKLYLQPWLTLIPASIWWQGQMINIFFFFFVFVSADVIQMGHSKRIAHRSHQCFMTEKLFRHPGGFSVLKQQIWCQNRWGISSPDNAGMRDAVTNVERCKF